MGTALALSAKPGGSAAWLAGLRCCEVSAAAACAALQALPGVGPKVAACAALLSLDKHGCVPVDTHVWQLARAHYAQQLPPEARAAPPGDVIVKAEEEPAAAGAAQATPEGAPQNEAKKKKAEGFTLRKAAAVELALQRLFGPYAGWAQTALFVAELRQLQAALPPHLRTPKAPPSASASKTPKATPKEQQGGDAKPAKKRAAKRKLEDAA